MIASLQNPISGHAELSDQNSCVTFATYKFTLAGPGGCVTISVAKQKSPGWSHIAWFSSCPTLCRTLQLNQWAYFLVISYVLALSSGMVSVSSQSVWCSNYCYCSQTTFLVHDTMVHCVGLTWGYHYSQSHGTWRRAHWTIKKKACSEHQQKLHFASRML